MVCFLNHIFSILYERGLTCGAVNSLVYSFFSRNNHEVPSIESSNLGHPDDQEVWEQEKSPSIWHYDPTSWFYPSALPLSPFYRKAARFVKRTKTFFGRRGLSINTKRNIITTGEGNGQKQFKIKMGKRKGHSRIMKIEGTWKRMMNRDDRSSGRIL